MSKSNRRVRRSFTAEYKAQAVELVRAGGKSAGQVAKDLDLAGSALRDWVKQADAAATTGEAPLPQRHPSSRQPFAAT